MITTCSQLLSLPSFQKYIFWPVKAASLPHDQLAFCNGDPSVSDWLHGGELVFVTCSYYQTSENDMIPFYRKR